MKNLAIRVDKATKYFDRSGRLTLRTLLTGLDERTGFAAVDAIDLQVPRGEVVGVLGRNGAGKSSLLRMVGGVYAPDRGAVSVTGDLVGLFELGGMGNEQLTGREFARRYLQLFDVPRARHLQLLEDVKDFSELGDYFDERIASYSAGMGARLYFAVATAVPHDVYLIDEVLSVGDEHFQAKSWGRMRERLAGGASGLLVTHDWSAVIKLCRESKVLERGKVVRSGPSDQVVADYLGLSPPAGERARIIDPDPQSLQARTRADWTLQFGVESFVEEAVEVSLSIEALQLGVGWEAVILTEFQPVCNAPGKYSLQFRVADLPLAPGTYALNLFLASAALGVGRPRETLDGRSWTYGNGLTLTVSGEPCAGLAPIPLRWRNA